MSFITTYSTISKAMFKLIISTCIASGFCGLSLAHQGHSEAYKEYLNQPKPEWLSIGEPIKVKVVESGSFDISKSSSVIVYPRSISIPEKKIKIVFPYQLLGGASWGKDGSHLLSPDKRMLVVNAGDSPKVYEILEQGSYKEADIDFPKLTFDSEKRGVITGWRWASDGALLAESAIENEGTGEHENSRVYVYHWEEKILSRLDLDSLNLKSLENVEIVGVSQDASYLKINVGGKVYDLQADLKSIPKLLKRDAVPKRPERINPQHINRKPSSSSNKSLGQEVETEQTLEKSRLPWIIAGVLLLGILALIFKIFKGKSKS